VGGFDMIWDGGPVRSEQLSSLPTLLGCSIADRVAQLKKLDIVAGCAKDAYSSTSEGLKGVSMAAVPP